MSTYQASAIALKFEEVPLSALFNAANAAARQNLSDMMSSSTAQSTGGRKQGQVSPLRLEPLTLDQKIFRILSKIKDGKLTREAGVSLDEIKLELKTPRYAGKSVDDMVSELKDARFLKRDQPKPRPATPTPAFSHKLKLLQPSFALMA
jgi:hypothetical protein